jgi:hypothetical protein
MLRKLIAFVFLVACVWIGLEVYTKGADEALGDLRAKAQGVSDRQASTMQRVQRSASAARDQQLDRVERQLGDGSVGLRED